MYLCSAAPYGMKKCVKKVNDTIFGRRVCSLEYQGYRTFSEEMIIRIWNLSGAILGHMIFLIVLNHSENWLKLYCIGSLYYYPSINGDIYQKRAQMTQNVTKHWTFWL